MRISNDKTDPGYANWEAFEAAGKKVEVALYGVIQPYVDLADDVEGFLRRCVLTADGSVQVNPAHPNQVWTEIVWGTVTFIISDRAVVVDWSAPPKLKPVPKRLMRY